MEDQTITTTTAPRITLKKNFAGQYGWDIALSSEDSQELIKRIEEQNKIMLKKFKEEK